MKQFRIGTTESSSRFHHYESVVKSEGFQWVGQLRGPLDSDSLASVDAMIFSDEFWQPTRLAIFACRMAGVATFHVLDGIVEWRNVFENPRSCNTSNGAPLFQPLISDLTFCLGPEQEFALRWLGNGSVSATGLPRLDSLPVAACRRSKRQTPPVLLIATANTPWFDEQQKQTLVNQFRRLAELLTTDSTGEQEELKIHWRIAEELAKEIHVETSRTGTLRNALEQCDGLITTPSTVAVEAILLGIPTLVFDPFCSPSFIPSAWMSDSPDGVLRLLPSLLAGCPNRAALQDALRQRICPIDQGATQRVASKIHEWLSNRRTDSVPVTGSPFEVDAPCDATDSSLRDLLIGMQRTIPSLETRISTQQNEISLLKQKLSEATLSAKLKRLLKTAIGKGRDSSAL